MMYAWHGNRFFERVLLCYRAFAMTMVSVQDGLFSASHNYPKHLIIWQNSPNS